jgi:hypothetical protein
VPHLTPTTRPARPARPALLAVAALTALAVTTPTATASPAAPARTAAAPAPTYTGLDTVSGWGGFDSGQSRTPASLARRDVVAVSAGPDHSLALTADGAVTGWGWNGDGQARPPAALAAGTWRAVAIDAGDHHSLAILDNGSIAAWGALGDTDEGQADVPAELRAPEPGSDARALDVAAGRYHTLALVDSLGGTVRAWGADNEHGAIDAGQTDVPDALQDGSVHVVDVAAGAQHSLALDDTGRVWAWGLDGQAQAQVPEELDGVPVQAVAAYGYTSLALTRSGRVVAWGDSGTGTTAVPATVTRATVTAIDIGSEIAAARTSDGRVLTWGDTATPVPAAIARHAPFTAVAAGGRHTLVVHRLPKTATRLILTAPARAPRGRPVTLTVRLTGTTTGRVVVREGSRTVATIPLRRSGAAATGSRTVRLAPGRHRLVASYAGTAFVARASSPARTVTITAR